MFYSMRTGAHPPFVGAKDEQRSKSDDVRQHAHGWHAAMSSVYFLLEERRFMFVFALVSRRCVDNERKIFRVDFLSAFLPLFVVNQWNPGLCF
jgi:hypothetical protein